MRIVSLSPSSTEILFLLGAGEQIVANTSFCDYPAASRKIPKVGDWIHASDEKILSFHPDLIISSTFVQNRAPQRFKNKKILHVHLDPRSLQDIYRNILFLGELTQTNHKAKEVVSKMKSQVSEIKNKRTRKKLRVYIEEWFDPPMASGNWVSDIVKIAGGEYRLIKKGEISQEIPFGKIKKHDPEIIFVSYCGYKDKSDINRILKRPGWEDITAVKQNRVYAIDDTYLNRPGPRVLQSALQMQKILTTI